MFGIRKRTILRKALGFGFKSATLSTKLSLGVVVLQFWTLALIVMYFHYFYGIKREHEEGNEEVSGKAK